MSHKPQYQHYVPQFILRKFSDYKEPDEAQFINKKAFTAAQKRAKKKAKVKTVDFSRDLMYANGCLRERPCESVFGINDMYDGEVEKALSKLEQKAANVIKTIEADFRAGRGSTNISRPDKDLLRRFVFIMHYRNRRFHMRFSERKEDYKSIDRQKLLEYMDLKRFETPKDVWLANIDAFMNVDLSQDLTVWSKRLQEAAYPPDALWFTKNMTASHICFCTPESEEEEFLLTQNAYNVYEGPETPDCWMDWHTFAPINPRLIIVSRSNHLLGEDSLAEIPDPKVKDLILERNKSSRDTITSQYPNPEQARSCLTALPVKKATVTYASNAGTTSTDLGLNGITQADIFQFQFFKIPSSYTQLINSVFFEQAVFQEAIIYKSERGLRNALDSYLTLDQAGMKTVRQRPADNDHEDWYPTCNGFQSTDQVPEYSRRAFLEMLQRIAGQLGSKCVASYRSEIFEGIDSAFLRRYTNLGMGTSKDMTKLTLQGFDGTESSISYDLQQAHCISRFYILTGRMLARSPRNSAKKLAQINRIEFMTSLPARRVWLHLRMSRLFHDPDKVLCFADPKEVVRTLLSDHHDGYEDTVADCSICFEPGNMSRALLRASMMDAWVDINTYGPRVYWHDEYIWAAWSCVKGMTDCDIPVLKEAACSLYRGSNIECRQHQETIRKLPMNLPTDKLIREKLSSKFEILVSPYKFSKQDIASLRILIFRDLYPLDDILDK